MHRFALVFHCLYPLHARDNCQFRRKRVEDEAGAGKSTGIVDSAQSIFPGVESCRNVRTSGAQIEEVVPARENIRNAMRDRRARDAFLRDVPGRCARMLNETLVRLLVSMTSLLQYKINNRRR